MIQNPILRGFCPDPSIIRVKDDYYIAVSTFEWWPGVKLFHSQDLKHWEQIASPLCRKSQLNMTGDPTSGGVWAPCLSYDGAFFYLVYTDVKTKKGRYYNTHNYMVYTDDINGKWSKPIFLNSIGFDPSLFHDTDGRKYLVNMVNGFKGVLVQELSFQENPSLKGAKKLSGWKLAGPRKKVYDGSGIGCTEGPHMYHIGGWYYLMTAEGGTGYDHCVTLARSKSVFGPFITAPGNPILTSDKENPDALQKCGHADFVDTPEGEWYLVHLCSRPINDQKWCTLGRETAIQKMQWDQCGWLRLAGGGRHARLETEEPKKKAGHTAPVKETQGYMGYATDIDENFNCASLPVCFVSPRISYKTFTDLQVRPGFLRMRGQESMNSLHRVSLLAVRQQEISARAETAMEFSPDYPEQLAGITYMYDAMNFYIFGKTAADNGTSVLTLIKSDTGIITDEITPIPVNKKDRLMLSVEISQDGTQTSFFYKTEAMENWQKAGDAYSTQIITDEHCRGFTGAHFGMYIHDMTGLGYYADFDSFSVKYAKKGI